MERASTLRAASMTANDGGPTMEFPTADHGQPPELGATLLGVACKGPLPALQRDVGDDQRYQNGSNAGPCGSEVNVEATLGFTHKRVSRTPASRS